MQFPDNVSSIAPLIKGVVHLLSSLCIQPNFYNSPQYFAYILCICSHSDNQH